MRVSRSLPRPASQPRWRSLGRRRLPTALLGLACLASLLLSAWLPLWASGPAVPAIVAVAVGTPTRPLPVSSEALALQSPWSRPASYPLSLRPRADLYRPSADWIGRLILPSPAELADPQAPGGDWVWIELEQAPPAARALIGRRLRLTWADTPELSRLVQAVTTDIHLGPAARHSAARGDVVPSRLDGRRRVGPLQTLAGARPLDDMTVQLEDVQLEGVQLEGGQRDDGRGQGDVLRIARPPVQITGRWQALVRFEAPANDSGSLSPVQQARKASSSSSGAMAEAPVAAPGE